MSGYLHKHTAILLGVLNRQRSDSNRYNGNNRDNNSNNNSDNDNSDSGMWCEVAIIGKTEFSEIFCYIS